MTASPDTGRFRLQHRPADSYTVEGLESLAYNGQIDRDTLIARDGSSDYRPAGSWEFAVLVFPVKKALTIARRVEDTGLVTTGFKLAKLAPVPGMHITSMEEIKTLIRHDPHDPRVLVLLNALKERMHAEGLSVEQVFADFFASNLALNQRLTVKVIYRHVSEAVRANRASALGLGVLANVMLGYTAIFASDVFECEFALGGAIVLTGVLCFFAVNAYHIERWLDIHPILAGLLLMCLISAGVTGIELGIVYDSDLSPWQNVLRVLVAPG